MRKTEKRTVPERVHVTLLDLVQDDNQSGFSEIRTHKNVEQEQLTGQRSTTGVFSVKIFTKITVFFCV